MEYLEFLETKQKAFIESGFDMVDLGHNFLFDYQKYTVSIACKKGRFAIFADCGLGKTLMQLEWAAQVVNNTNRKVLVLAPFAVVAQTILEGQKFGFNVSEYGKDGMIQITNYEQINNIDVYNFSGVVLDESSILKSKDGKTSSMLIDTFKHFEYKLACTATPSPNDHMELGQHSEFLNAMTYLEMLSMFFVHDGGETSKWRLRKHATDDFWKFVCTWSISIDNPKTLGFDGSGYCLPDIEYIEHFVSVDNNSNLLFAENSVSATDINRDLKRSLNDRVNKVAELVNNSSEQWIVWCLHNDESEMLKGLINDSRNVKGSDSPESKAKNLLGFARNEFKVLITKVSIAAFGMNFQNCCNQVFCSYDFKFEKFYQGVRRSYRFMQRNKVSIHLMIPESQQNVRTTILEKQKKHIKMISEMAKYSANSDYKMNKVETVKNADIKSDMYWLMNGDCVQKSKLIPDKSVDLQIFSPPFAELYVYSDKPEDMGNVKNYKEFEKHFQYLIPELKRTLKDGRICAVHCMDLPIQKGKEGFIGLRDFSGMIIKWFTEQGFIYHSRVTIWKNPVTEMQRTKALGLLHKTIKKDASMSRVGIPDYVLFFRNEGENKSPIIHQDIDSTKSNFLPVDLWQKYASPVWYDVNYSRTLQYTTARGENDEKHICPLQLDTIERIIHLYSNEGETVMSPFGGIGSEGYQALKMKRKSISIELKESYFNVNAKNHKEAIDEKSQLTLF